MNKPLTTDPKIIDVIAQKPQYGNRTHYYIVVDQEVNYVYTRSPVVERQAFAQVGQSFFLGRCGDFYDFLAGTGRKGEAFGGREFDINLDDGSTFHCQGDVWACCSRKTDPAVVDVGVQTLKELRKCYVFFGGHILKYVLDEWLAMNTPATDYYKYEPHWRSPRAPVVRTYAPIDSDSYPRRKVGKQRARKLRRRGEFVWWDSRLRSLVWIKQDHEPMDDAERYALGAM